MAALIFWTSFAVAFYVYVGYPLLLVLWSRIRCRTVRKAPCEPAVSIILAVFNERERIEQRLRNCLELDYPKHKLQILVSLDGPTDGTDALVAAFGHRGVEIVRGLRHQGKAAALNRAVSRARGDILLFADARQVFAPNVVRELAANFSDPEVGVVSGELILLDERQNESVEGIGLYWRYEKLLRSMESSVHSLLGATGAIYAMRRELFVPLPQGTILDDVLLPMQAVLKNRRAVLDRAARAFDLLPRSPEAEYRRKVRTLTGNFQVIVQLPQLLIPWRNPVFWQFVSHKVGRLVTPYFLIALFFSNLFLLHGIYLAAFIVQALWYVLIPVGFVISRSTRAASRADLIGAQQAGK